MIMKKLVIAISLIIVAVTLSGCIDSYNRASVTVENLSGEEVSEIVVESLNNSVFLNSIANGESKTIKLINPFGESCIKLTYVLKGEKHEWEGGYIESSWHYHDKLTINQDETVSYNDMVTPSKFGRPPNSDSCIQ